MRYFEDREIRAVTSEGDKTTIAGHPAVFNQEVQIGRFFREMIDVGAFDDTDMSDVFLFVNHENQIPLARCTEGRESTMSLTVDDKGLLMTATLDTANNADAKKLYSAIQRGDISGMSFSFIVGDEEWQELESDLPLRIVKRIAKVFEVSVVTFPAYSETDISARDVDKAILDAARTQSPNYIKRQIEDYKTKIQILGGLKL